MNHSYPPTIRSFRLTREGRWFLLLLMGVGFAAFNTGNNLLYLVLSMKVGVFALQLLLCRSNIKNLSVHRTAPNRAVASEIFPVSLHITNKSKRFPVFGIQVRDFINGQKFKRSGHFMKADPGETRHIEYRCELHHRGRSHFSDIIVSSAFPFGFTERTRRIPIPHDIIIWPRRVPVHLPRQFSLLHEGDMPIPHKGASNEFWQLRNFHHGDDARRISWKSTARHDRLILMETEAQSDTQIEIALSLVGAASADETERIIETAASLIDTLHRRNTMVRLISFETAGMTTTPQSCAHLIDHLALLDSNATAASKTIAHSTHALVIDRESVRAFVNHFPPSMDFSEPENSALRSSRHAEASL